MLGGQLLAFRRVEIVEIGLGHLAGTVLVDILVDDRDRRLREDRDGRHHDLELALAELVLREERLVLPGDQHVAESALDEGGGGAAGAGGDRRRVDTDRLFSPSVVSDTYV